MFQCCMTSWCADGRRQRISSQRIELTYRPSVQLAREQIINVDSRQEQASLKIFPFREYFRGLLFTIGIYCPYSNIYCPNFTLHYILPIYERQPSKPSIESRGRSDTSLKLYFTHA